MTKKDLNSKFKGSLIAKLNEKDLSPSTIKYYISNLERLNDNKPLSNFDFLKDKEKIMKLLDKFKPNTKRNYLISIVALLGLDKKNNKLLDLYYDDMMAINKSQKIEEAKGEKTETQKKNWVLPEEIEEIRKKFQTNYDKFKNEKDISKSQFAMLLNYIIFSLYTLIPPRRNKDYQQMYIIKNVKPDHTENYLDVNNKEFIFNAFKTVKSEGQQITNIPEDLMSILNVYIKFHPLIYPEDKSYEVPFLVNYDGIPIESSPMITKILNNIFKKKVGPTMLRHIYLSNKYGKVKEQMANDAKDMGHSVAMQKDYIKK